MEELVPQYPEPRRAAADEEENSTGTWIDDTHWQCYCPLRENRRSAVLPYCATCDANRPSQQRAAATSAAAPSPATHRAATTSADYGSFTDTARRQRETQHRRRLTAQANDAGGSRTFHHTAAHSAQQQMGAGATQAGHAAHSEQQQGAGVQQRPPFRTAAEILALLQEEEEQQGEAVQQRAARQGWREQMHEEEEEEQPTWSARPGERVGQFDDGTYYQLSAPTAEQQGARLRGARDTLRAQAPFVRDPMADQVRHGQQAQRRSAQHAPNHLGDCRGVASVRFAEEIAYRVSRAPARRVGYCRRNTCECCAPIAGRANWCSCIAVQDGLCRRCWLDLYVGTTFEAGQFYHP